MDPRRAPAAPPNSPGGAPLLRTRCFDDPDVVVERGGEVPESGAKPAR